MGRHEIVGVVGFCLPAIAWIAVLLLVIRPLLLRGWTWSIDALSIIAIVLIVAKVASTVRGVKP